MRTVRFDEYGDYDVLKVVEVPEPAPGPGEGPSRCVRQRSTRLTTVSSAAGSRR